jgi:hypothetical protein
VSDVLSHKHFLGLVPLLTWIHACTAATWYVAGSARSSGDGSCWEAPFTTVQEGIEAALPGDTVIVAEGTYAENIRFGGKNIALRSTDPVDPTVVASTVIDGGGAGSVVTFDGTEGESCVLSGLTVRNGNADGSGGGISGGYGQVSTRARIENNIITANFAWGSGGGILNCDGVIRANRIERNEAGVQGGGLYRCGGLIDNNLIVGNLSGYGAGLERCRGTIQGCTIAGNSAVVRGGGMDDCDATVRNNIISRNYAEAGGGLALCDGILENNTVAGNRAYRGGAFTDCDGTIINCIIVGNSATTGEQVPASSAPRYSCIEGWDSGGPGNMSTDPLFVDPDGPDDDPETWEDNDLHLAPGSPCIDAGQNGYWAGWPIRDRDGNARVANATVDMGCYEFSSVPDSDGDLLPDTEEEFFGTDPNEADTDADGLADGMELLRGSDPRSPTPPGVLRVPTDLPTVQQALDVCLKGETIVVEPGLYVENVDFLGKNVVLQGVDPANPDVVAKTIIDGGGAGPVVSLWRVDDGVCVVSGLTIRGGDAQGGGGICGGPWNMKARVRIQNNVIAGNRAGEGGGVSACEGLIEHNVFVGNWAYAGGALSGCDGTIRNNLVTANFAGYWGGGLLGCAGEILDNIIVGNSVEDGGGGGVYDVTGLVSGNVIAHNRADWAGGLGGARGRIVNNTIVGNRAESWGGGLDGCGDEIVNCILWANEAPEGAEFHESSQPRYSCIQDWTGGGEGNIALDPHFVDPDNGDYHLKSWSPCIDAGDPSFPFSSEPEPNGGRIDMGAYGNTPEATPGSPDADADGLPDDWETHWFGDLQNAADSDPDGDGIPNVTEYRYGWDPTIAATTLAENLKKNLRYQTIRAALLEADEGDEIVVHPGTYSGGIRFPGKNVVLRSVAPTDPQVVANTILEGTETVPGVSFSGTESWRSVLSGFTIRRGKGGVHEPPSWPVWANNTATIRNNVITENSGTGIAYCDGIIENNVISNNSGEQGGGLLWCNGLIQNNLIVGNSAQDEGGGLNLCDGTIQDNTIYGNSAGEKGGGLCGCDGTIRNCIIWGNAAPQGAQLDASTKPTYSCVQDPRACGQWCIISDPCFVDRGNGDFRLMPGSPCIDAGFNDPELPQRDIAGMHRIMFGGKSLTVDMGAYEFYVNALTRGPSADQTTFTWSSLAAKTYSIFYTDDLLTWRLAVESFPSSGNQTAFWIDDGFLTGLPPSLVPRRFYRILENP